MASRWGGDWLGKWLGDWQGEAEAAPGAMSGTASFSISCTGTLSVAESPALTHTSGGGSGVQFAQKRRRAKLLARTQEDEEMAMVMAVLAQIGVFA